MMRSLYWGGAVVVSVLPDELNIDLATLHAHDAEHNIDGPDEGKSHTGLFDARWTRPSRHKLAAQRGGSTPAKRRPAAQVLLAKDAAWQLAPGPKSQTVAGFQVVWIDNQAKLYVTHYIYV